jgi:hypothetical protein
MQDNWRYDAGHSCPQRMRIPDYFGRATVSEIARPEISCDLSAALGMYTNAESYLRASHQTRLRGRCDDHDYVPPDRYMQILPYPWQREDTRPWTPNHITQNDVLDCRGVGLPIWKQDLVVKPAGRWSNVY